jgi:hypothetical protein
MIPSDHFVRFYNEVFKFLDEKNDLDSYYKHISKHQEFHCYETFKANGLKGIYDYYLKIRKEENCDLDIELNGHELILKMNVCPSLSKAVNNDAGVCPKYCDHCLGWTQPLYTKFGLYQIFDLDAWDNPQCCEWIFDDLTCAQNKYKELAKTLSTNRLYKNFEL